MTNLPNPQIGDHRFDEWIRLEKEEPEKFEQERKKTIEAVIQESPEEKQLRLRQLQFRIDGLRRKYKHNGLVSTQKIYEEMMSSFADLEKALTGFRKIPGLSTLRLL